MIAARPMTRLAGRLLILLGALVIAGAALAEELVIDGDFEATANGDELRKDNKGFDWYESRKDGEEGRGQLKLSSKKIGGNGTKKAMLKAHPELNTYLSFRLTEPQEKTASASFDIYVKEILLSYNRSAFFFMGGIADKKGGPNSTGKERFVFIGFENADLPGKINLFAREGSNKWSEKTIVAADLDLKTWYNIRVEADIADGVYTLWVEGQSEPFELESFYTKGKTPGKISHISFATWNDGPGTFYVDNVSVSGD